MFKIFLGFGILLLGIILLLSNLDIIAVDLSLGSLFATYWPMLIIVWGFTEVIYGLPRFIGGLKRRQRGSAQRLIWGLLIASVGIILQGNRLGIFHVSWGDFWSWVWPLLLIYIGYLIIFAGGPRVIYVNNRKRAERVRRDGEFIQKDHRLIGDINLGGSSWQLQDMNQWVGIGDIDLDLSRAVLSEGETNIELSGWIGDVNVWVPSDMAIKVNANIQIGDAIIFHHAQEGVLRNFSYISEGYEEADKKINLDISFFIGDVKVRWVD
ncbi:cell wall-active antibiotics response protein LiaF [Rubeoparvulum massiliense]|uniref:cell wall-active antibiotics response protein LiaF n=1 Tax=Rubeoparvulum massiliense TaxID=1631346 RepID=UPI00065E5BB5|nr:cell wall-active antibiotics response protein LiaF [Rubeoparvulum massiliense]